MERELDTFNDTLTQWRTASGLRERVYQGIGQAARRVAGLLLRQAGSTEEPHPYARLGEEVPLGRICGASGGDADSAAVLGARVLLAGAEATDRQRVPEPHGAELTSS